MDWHALLEIGIPALVGVASVIGYLATLKARILSELKTVRNDLEDADASRTRIHKSISGLRDGQHKQDIRLTKVETHLKSKPNGLPV